MTGGADGNQLTRFRIERELASGGMATVFAAYDATTGQRVALKRLRPDTPPRVAALFEREFYVLSSLKHPRIIEVYEYGIDSHGPYYTMELLEGADLRESSPLPPSAACRHLRDIASSLALLHARRLIHRDVSPRNVRTLPHGGCKLFDFGALASFGSSEDVVGTPPAIPPESLAGQPLDQRADLYSLGALAYFVLTGQHAFPARTVSALPDAWAMPLLAPSRFAPAVPKDLDALVLALLNLDTLARPTSAAEVIERLNVIGGLEPEHDEQVARAYIVGTRLVEREVELNHADQLLQRARAGDGGALLFEAEAGLGKTRLLNEIALKAQLLGFTPLRADAAEQAGPLLTARALVRQALRLAPGVATAIFKPHGRTLAALWGESLSAFTRGSPITSIPPPEVAAANGGEPVVIEHCLLELARKQPLLIAVDNIDEADARSAALLMALARHARGEPLLVVATASARPKTVVPALRGIREAAQRLPLRELSERGTTEVVQTAFGDVPHVRRTAQRLYAATRGNPSHCMQLLQRWLADGLIRYIGGSFSLPLDIPEPLLMAAEDVARDRLLRCSPAALTVAHTLALADMPVSLETCVELAAPELSSREALAGFEELVAADVLVESPLGPRFTHELLQTMALESLDDVTCRRLHLRLGEQLLLTGDGGIETRARAGLHVLRSGEAERGAELIAQVARDALKTDQDRRMLARIAGALEAALHVYRRLGRSRLEQLELLVPLTVASYEISPAFAQRYGEAALSALTYALGLDGWIGKPTGPDASELLARLAQAPQLEPGYIKRDTTPNVITLVDWLVRSVISLTAVAAAAIDHEAEARAIECLRPFIAFGPTHPAAFAYEFTRLILSMSEDRLSQSHRGWSELLARVDQIALPPSVRLRIRIGSLFSLGLLECQRDDDVALARLRQLDSADDSPQTRAMANQLRALYYGFRGESAKAEQYRDALETYAVQYGSAWQAEIWSTSTQGLVCGNTRDVAGLKRCVEQLKRLMRDTPSLVPYWERARAGLYVLTRSPERALELYDRTLARAGARDRVGWTAVQGGVAFALNDLGEHARARQICEETIAHNTEDADYVAANLTLRLELCRALAGLGEYADALAKLEALFEAYAWNANPVTVGSLHRTAADIARRCHDVIGFEHHLDAMQRCYQPTGNPALIAQCESLRNAASGAGEPGDGHTDDPVTIATAYHADSSAATTHQNVEQRKRRALQLLASQAGVQDALLFARRWDDEPMLVGAVGATEGADDAVMTRVRALFARLPADDEDTVIVPGSAVASPTLGGPRHRLLPLTVLREAKPLLIGAVAIPAHAPPKPMSAALLNDLALQLLKIADLDRNQAG